MRSRSTTLTRTRHRPDGHLCPGLLVVALCTGGIAACTLPPARLTQLVEARRLTSELHVQFTHAADAANRAVMADTNDASNAAAEEARRARQAIEQHAETLRPLLESLGSRDDVRQLDGFTSQFAEYRRLDDEILSLAVENTNVKAQRLSFGPAQEAANAFRSSIDAALHGSAPKEACRGGVDRGTRRDRGPRGASHAGAAYR